MKTLTKTLFATVLTAVLFTSVSSVSFAATKIEVASAAQGFNKIWVAGNVKIILTQSENEGVFADEDFNSGTTSVERKGQTLYINSTEHRQVTIHVSVKDLQRIEAAGNAVVVTSNNFDVKYLQVFLSQDATAKVSAIAESLYTQVSDGARLKMSGSADQHTLIAANMKNVKFENFVSMNTSRQVSGSLMAADQVALKAK